MHFLLNQIKLALSPGSTSSFIKPNWVAAIDYLTGRKIPRSFLFYLIWIANHLSPRRLWKIYKVRKSLNLPKINNLNNKQNSIWGISLVRDEEDIIEPIVRNLFNQGCAGILIADHGSKDSTLEILHKLQLEYPNLYVGTYMGTGYFQSLVVTKLASIARSAGAKWIIPFDADEIWVTDAKTMRESLEKSNAGVVVADLYNCFPIGNVKRIENYLIDSNPVSMKCALRAHRGLMIEQGNHFDLSKWSKKQKGLIVLHFPWRSKEQLLQKVKQGAQADSAAGLSNGKHWHWAANLSDELIDDVWLRITEGLPVPELGWTRIDQSSQLYKIDWHEQLGPRPIV